MLNIGSRQTRKRIQHILVVFTSIQVLSLAIVPQVSSELKTGSHFRYTKADRENTRWSNLPVPRISANFTKQQRQLLWEALLKIQDRMQSKAVLECISKNATDGYYRDETPVKAAQRVVAGAQLRMVKDDRSAQTRRQQLFIETGAIEDSTADAFAYFGESRNTKKDLTMYIVQDKMGTKNSDYWAGVIVHEVLHIYTYKHPAYNPNKGYFDQFKGNMMFETEWCVSGRRKKSEDGVWYIDAIFNENYEAAQP
jgi:hypothetical protein